MRVAIIGGTGFVGSYLIDELSHLGHSIALLVRPGSEIKIKDSIYVTSSLFVKND